MGSVRLNTSGWIPSLSRGRAVAMLLLKLWYEWTSPEERNTSLNETGTPRGRVLDHQLGLREASSHVLTILEMSPVSKISKK